MISRIAKELPIFQIYCITENSNKNTEFMVQACTDKLESLEDYMACFWRNVISRVLETFPYQRTIPPPLQPWFTLK